MVIIIINYVIFLKIFLIFITKIEVGRVESPPQDRQKFRSFFSVSHHNFLSFFPLGGSLECPRLGSRAVV